MAFKEITNKQWDAISQHLPRPARTGRPSFPQHAIDLKTQLTSAQTRKNWKAEGR